MPRHLCIAMAAASLALGCAEDPGEADAVYVRLHNTTAFNFDSLAFFTQAEDSFGPLPAGAFSGFLPVEGLYTVEGGVAEAGELRFFGMVFDHLGDELIGVGYHTYDVFADVDHPEYYLEGYDGAVYFQETY